MNMKNKILKLSGLVTILISICFQGFAFAQTKKTQNKKSTPTPTPTPTSSNTTPPVTNTPPPSYVNVENKERITMRNVNPYNGWIWGGAGFLFESGNLINYMAKPTMDYQVGVGKSIGNITPDDFAYIALIFDYAQSKYNLGSCCTASFYATNEQILLGYEQSFGTPYFAGFLEAGGVFQQRTFSIQADSTATDFFYATQWGGSFNGGFNIKIVPERRVSYLFRLGMNLMIGMARNETLNYDGSKLNVNPISYGPSVSFGVRM